jgi:hypothetical protein
VYGGKQKLQSLRLPSNEIRCWGAKSTCVDWRQPAQADFAVQGRFQTIALRQQLMHHTDFYHISSAIFNAQSAA